MSRKVKVEALGDAINQELTLYSSEITSKTKKITTAAMKKLVSRSKESAPKRTGNYAKHISSRTLSDTPSGRIEQWYVRPNQYGLTHLLEHPHLDCKKKKLVTKGNGWLSKTADDVIDQYEKDIENAIKNS